VPVAELVDHPVGQVDLAIVPIGVVEARLRSASRVACRDQRTAVKRIATARAKMAIPYWKMVIA
jgi:hypothetical protein